MAKLHGKDSLLKIGNTVICVTEWEAEEVYDEHPTNGICGGEDADYHSLEFGRKQLVGSAKGQLDLATQPYTKFSTGASVALELFYVGTDTEPTYDVPKAMCNNVKVTGTEGDKINYSFNFKSSGAYTINEDTGT